MNNFISTNNGNNINNISSLCYLCVLITRKTFEFGHTIDGNEMYFAHGTCQGISRMTHVVVINLGHQRDQTWVAGMHEPELFIDHIVVHGLPLIQSSNGIVCGLYHVPFIEIFDAIKRIVGWT